MNKSVAVIQLHLPHDVIDCICSYLFCSLDQSKEQNKQRFKEVLQDIKNDVLIDHVPLFARNGYIIYFMYIQFPVREHKVIYTNLCGNCGNFIILKGNSFGCKCFK